MVQTWKLAMKRVARDIHVNPGVIMNVGFVHPQIVMARELQSKDLQECMYGIIIFSSITMNTYTQLEQKSYTKDDNYHRPG